MIFENFEKSPFSYNDVVTGELFVGRKNQIFKLQNNIFACQNTTVYGNRKVGKSSLVQEAIRIYQKEKRRPNFFLTIDLSQCTSINEFINILCTGIDELVKTSKPLKHKFSELANFIGSVRPVATIDPITGQLEYSFDFIGMKKNINKTIDDTFDLLESIAGKDKLTVVLDEFQTIVYWPESDKLLWMMRSRIQKQNNIGYIFMGSSNRLISELFLQSKSAFYKSTNLIYVDNKLDWFLVFPWIKKQFTRAKMKVSNEIVKEILDLTRYHPYYTQKLCYYIWRNKNKPNTRKRIEITMKDFKDVLGDLINEEKMVYQERFDKLSINQKLVIKALAKKEPNENIASKRLQARYYLPGRAGVRAVLKSLEKEMNPLVYKEEEFGYIVEDPFFELWLKVS